MDEPLKATDILYDTHFNVHLLLLEQYNAEDYDGRLDKAWQFLILETGNITWCWEYILEDEIAYWRKA